MRSLLTIPPSGQHRSPRPSSLPPPWSLFIRRDVMLGKTWSPVDLNLRPAMPSRLKRLTILCIYLLPRPIILAARPFEVLSISLSDSVLAKGLYFFFTQAPSSLKREIPSSLRYTSPLAMIVTYHYDYCIVGVTSVFGFTDFYRANI